MTTSGSKSNSFTNWDDLVFTWRIWDQSIENNTSTIVWEAQLVSGSSGRIDSSVNKYIQVVVDGKTKSANVMVNIPNNGTKTLLSGATVITHNADGTKEFTFSVDLMLNITFSGSSIGTVTVSGTGKLDDIPRLSTISVSDGYLGQAQTITVTRKSSSFKHKITYTCGSLSGTVCSGTDSNSSATSISFTPPLSLAAANTSGQSVNVTYTIQTINGSTTLSGKNTKTVTYTMQAEKFAPTVLLSVSDPTGIKTTYGNYVKGLSKFAVSATATAKQSATISSHSTVANGTTYYSLTPTTSALNKAGAQNITVTVKDSRGFTGTATVSVDVLDYAPPAITKLTVKRCNSDGTENNQGEYVNAKFNFSVSGLSGKNTYTGKLRYKKSSESTYTDIDFSYQDLQSNTVSATFAAASDSSYDIEAVITDKHNTAVRATSASTAFTLFHVRSDGTGIAFGKLSENANTFDFGLPLRNSGGFMNEVLDKYNDLNDVMIPNTYVSINQGASYYSNCPITSGTFVLEVMSAGAEGQLMQRLTTTFMYGAHQVFVRHYYQGSWGCWICVQDKTTYDGGDIATHPGVSFGWLGVSLESGISYGTEMGGLKSKVSNGVLYIKGDVKGINENWKHFGTLPLSVQEMLPKRNIRFVGVYNVSYFASFVITSGKNLLVAGNSEGTWDATKNFSINVAIPIEEK